MVVPSGVVSTGWPAARDTCAGFGVRFDSWQDGAGRLILAKRSDGKYAASIGGVVMSIPRQVGKTFLIGAVAFALCLLTPGTTVLWTAHRLRTAGETFSKMQSFARRKKVAPHVSKIVLGSGDEAIEFHNGSRILFGARERGFGRGFDNVDVEVFDEAQILTENAIDDMVPATNTAVNPLLIFIGTPPKPSDPSEVFSAKRARALSEPDGDTAYVEFSADQGCDPDSRTQWAKANPSYPSRTNEAAMLRMRQNLSPESFVREALGVWDVVTIGTVFGPGEWEAWSKGVIPAPEVFSLDVNPDRSHASIGVADATGLCALSDHRPGVGWAVDEIIRLSAEYRTPVAVQSTGAAGALIADLERAHVNVVPYSHADVRAACGQLFDAVVEHKGGVRSDPALDRAVATAVKKKSADAWVWDRRGNGDVSPLVAITLARHAALAGTGPSVYEEKELRVF